jgi:hypothetical protein
MLVMKAPSAAPRSRRFPTDATGQQVATGHHESAEDADKDDDGANHANMVQSGKGCTGGCVSAAIRA